MMFYPDSMVFLSGLLKPATDLLLVGHIRQILQAFVVPDFKSVHTPGLQYTFFNFFFTFYWL